MTTQTVDGPQEQPVLSPSAAASILERLDAMLVELQALRQEVQAMAQTQKKQPQNLADELYGSLGQGSWEELDPNADIEWMRFGT